MTGGEGKCSRDGKLQSSCGVLEPGASLLPRRIRIAEDREVVIDEKEDCKLRPFRIPSIHTHGAWVSDKKTRKVGKENGIRGRGSFLKNEP